MVKNWLLKDVEWGCSKIMMQKYQLAIFAFGIIGIVISFILLIRSVIKHKKGLKIISAFLFITFIGTTVGYYYETLKDVTNNVNKVNDEKEAKVEKKPTSGSSDDPLIITEKEFYDDANYYYTDFEVKNNSDVEISKLSFHIIFTYEANMQTATHDEHIFLLDSVIPPKMTLTKNYLWRKSMVERKLGVKNIKMNKIENVICYVNINGEEKPMKVDELKVLLKSTK
ncbi:hypothetical protein [Clostridium sp. C2-6-12]|uniref:hypothetical protein n=1 Tax=Clostridium sp. C2-6-12 TaxID=2698832 RepID=UPI00136AE453|nr:hypothetical protein [Clostridium sp. C2-6-12]